MKRSADNGVHAFPAAGDDHRAVSALRLEIAATRRLRVLMLARAAQGGILPADLSDLFRALVARAPSEE